MKLLLRYSVLCVCFLQIFGVPTVERFVHNPFEDIQIDDVITTERAVNINDDYELKTIENASDFDGDFQGEDVTITELDISKNLVKTDGDEQDTKGWKQGNYEEENYNFPLNDKISESVKYDDNVKIESTTASIITRISGYGELEDTCDDQLISNDSAESNSAGSTTTITDLFPVIQPQNLPGANEEIDNRLNETNSEVTSPQIEAKQEERTPISSFDTNPSDFGTKQTTSANSEVISTENEEHNPISSLNVFQSDFIANQITTTPGGVEAVAETEKETDTKLAESYQFFETTPSAFNQKHATVISESSEIPRSDTARLEEQNPTPSLATFPSDAKPSQTISGDSEAVSTEIKGKLGENGLIIKEPNAFLESIPPGFNVKETTTVSENPEITTTGNTAKLNEANLVSFVETTPPGFGTKQIISSDTPQVIFTENGYRQRETGVRLGEQVSSDNTIRFAFGLKQTPSIPGVISAESEGRQEIRPKINELPPISSLGSVSSEAVGETNSIQREIDTKLEGSIQFFETTPRAFNRKQATVISESSEVIRSDQQKNTARLEEQNPTPSLATFPSDFSAKPSQTISGDSEAVSTEIKGKLGENGLILEEPNAFLESIPSGFNVKETTTVSENPEITTTGNTAKLNEANPVSFVETSPPGFGTKQIISSDTPQVIFTENGYRQRETGVRLGEQVSSDNTIRFAFGLKQTPSIPGVISAESEGRQEIRPKLNELPPISSLGSVSSEAVGETDSIQREIDTKLEGSIQFFETTPRAFNRKQATVISESSEVIRSDQQKNTARLEEQNPTSSIATFPSNFSIKSSESISGDSKAVSTKIEGRQGENDLILEEPNAFLESIPSGFNVKETTTVSENPEITTTGNTAKLNEANPVSFVETTPPGFGTKQIISSDTPQVIFTENGYRQQETGVRLGEQVSSDNTIRFAFDLKQTPSIPGVISAESEGRQEIRPKLNELPPISSLGSVSSGFNTEQPITASKNLDVISNENNGRQEEISPRLNEPNSVSFLQTTPSGFDGKQTISTSSQVASTESERRLEEITSRLKEPNPNQFTFTPSNFKETNSIAYDGVTTSGFPSLTPTTSAYLKQQNLFGFNEETSFDNNKNPSTTSSSVLQGNDVAYNGGIPFGITTISPVNAPNLKDGVTHRFKGINPIHFGELTTQGFGTVPTVPTTSALFLNNPNAKTNFKGFTGSFYTPTVSPTSIPGRNFNGPFGLSTPANGFGTFDNRIDGFNGKGGLSTEQFKFTPTSSPSSDLSELAQNNLGTTTESAVPVSTAAKTSTNFDLNPSSQYDIFTGIQTTPPPIEISSGAGVRGSVTPAVIGPNPNIELYSRVGDQETTIPFLAKGKVTIPYEILPPKYDSRVETTTQGSVKALFSGQIHLDPASSTKGFNYQSLGSFNLGVLTTGTASKTLPPPPPRALVPKLIYKKVENTQFSQGIIDKYTSSNLKIDTINLGNTGSINRVGDGKKTTFFNGFHIYNPSFAKYLK